MKLSILLLLALLVIGVAAGATLSLTLAQAANGVYDADGDKLIEISNLDQLDALRYDRDGNGAADRDNDAGEYSLVFPVAADQSVCDSGCNGYELANSLDFNQAASYRTGSVNTAWTDTTGEGWTPIVHRDGTETPKPYNAKFEGNGYTISNLYSNADRHRPRNRPFRPPGRRRGRQRCRAAERQHHRRLLRRRRPGRPQPGRHQQQLRHRHAEGQRRHRRAGGQQRPRRNDYREPRLRQRNRR